jgi:SAM-dependent methyltransferase
MSHVQSNADLIAAWNGDLGEKWVRAQGRLDAMLAGLTAKLIDAAGAEPGDRVLDVGCGCGETSLHLARGGAVVVGVDVSRPMLERARGWAREEGVEGLEFLEADASVCRFSPAFDLVFSRLGVMFFADADAAFVNLRRALRPGGRLVFACWRGWRENEWVRVLVEAVRPHVPLPPRPGPGSEAPGPFSFADAARVRRILTNAGFERLTIREFDTPLSFGATFDEALEHLRDLSPVAGLLAAVPDEQRGAAVAALDAALRPYAGRRPVTLGGASWLVTARA